MATIKPFFAMLGGSSQGLQTAVKNAVNTLKTLSNPLQVTKAAFRDLKSSTTSFFGSWQKQLVAFGASFIALSTLKDLLKDALNTLKDARSIGDTTENISKLQSSIKQLGGDASSIVPALTAMSQNIQSSFYSPTEDPFSRIGLSLDKLVKMRPSEQFTIVADAISKLESAEQKAAIAFQIFGDKAASILPLVTQNSEQLKKLGSSAENAGRSLNQVNATNLETLTIMVENAIDSFKGLFQAIALEVVPAIMYLFQSVFGVTSGMVDFGNAGRETAYALIKGFVFFRDVIDGIRFLFLNLRLVVYGFTVIILKVLGGIFSLMAELPGAAGRAFEGLNKAAKIAATGVRDAMIDDRKSIDKITEDLAKRNTDDIVSKIDEFKKQNAITRDAVATASGALPKLTINQDELNKGNQTLNENTTAFDKYKATLKQLDKQLKTGAISWTIYSRAVGKTVSELESAYSAQLSFSGAAKFGSSEDYSSRIRGMDAIRLNQENPQKRIERIQEQALIIEKKQEEYLKKIADAMQKMDQPKPVMI